MRTLLVTGSDTGVGKTRVVAALAQLLAADGARVQIVKVVETGCGGAGAEEGDAAAARRMSGVEAAAFTLAAFPAPLAPPAAASAAGRKISCQELGRHARALPPCDWRIFEGAGGIATPLDDAGNDWVDFAIAAAVDALVVVVPDRLGAINQARLAFARAIQAGRPAGVWLNAITPAEPAVCASNRTCLRAADVPLWAEQNAGALGPAEPERVRARLMTATTGEPHPPVTPPAVRARCVAALAARDREGLRRTLRVTPAGDGMLNLADNDYLGLAHDPAVANAAAAAALAHGTSASASPLLTGWREPHARLTERLCAWHGFAGGMLWSSGYAANSAVLGGLPARGDVVFADRLVHHSMIAGLLRSGARLRRYGHLQLDRLEQMLVQERHSGGQKFVVTESVFSMDGDYPELARMAELKRRCGFFWIVDEAHALGWYGREGAGLVRAAAVEADVDVLVGTLGKTLASGGAYTLFQDEAVRDYLVNTAGEFIYSTALPPANAAVALAAIDCARTLAEGQPDWHAASRNFRLRLQRAGWKAPGGDSPIVPVVLDAAEAAVSLAEALRREGILAAAVRPPTVPAGTSRLRFSLKRTFRPDDAARVISALETWRNTR